MRVAISTLPLTSEHKDRGIGTYTSELVAALKTVKTKKHTFSFFSDAAKIPQSTDLVHYPYFDPFFLTLPVFRDKPTVVTVHDLIPVLFPKEFPRGVRGEVKWQVQKRTLAGVTHIITDSECSKADIAREVGLSGEKVTVVPLAPPVAMKPERDPAHLAKTMARYNLPNEFVMYVGDVNWNKNIPGLLAAWQHVVSHHRLTKDAKLVLVGKAFVKEDLAEAAAIREQVKRLQIDDSVFTPGYVPDEDLRAMYMLSRACVFPSLYEGFGLPVLEAMACGGVVVTSNKASLSEVAGPSIIVNPNDAADIAEGMVKAVRLPTAIREAVVDKGITWAKTFSWVKTAKQTIAVYETVCPNA